MGRFEKEIDAFQAALNRAYQMGFNDGSESAKQQIINAISSAHSHATLSEAEVGPPTEPVKGVYTSKRKRAPRGLPRALILRVMQDNPSGVTPQQIVDAASTDFEKMIAVSSIRSELRKGEAEDRYLEIDGVWHLADSDEAEGITAKAPPSASNFSHERTQDASSVSLKAPL